jgi:hypothetical protein
MLLPTSFLQLPLLLPQLLLLKVLPAAAAAEDGGFLWVIKIPSTNFLRRGSKAVGPMS